MEKKAKKSNIRKSNIRNRSEKNLNDRAKASMKYYYNNIERVKQYYREKERMKTMLRQIRFIIVVSNRFKFMNFDELIDVYNDYMEYKPRERIYINRDNIELIFDIYKETPIQLLQK